MNFPHDLFSVFFQFLEFEIFRFRNFFSGIRDFFFAGIIIMIWWNLLERGSLKTLIFSDLQKHSAVVLMPSSKSRKQGCFKTSLNFFNVLFEPKGHCHKFRSTCQTWGFFRMRTFFKVFLKCKFIVSNTSQIVNFRIAGQDQLAPCIRHRLITELGYRAEKQIVISSSMLLILQVWFKKKLRKCLTPTPSQWTPKFKRL